VSPAEAGKTQNGETIKMNTMMMKLYVKFQDFKNREEGQDLVEYALLVSLIALAAITGVNDVATAVTKVFTSISSSLG
jgi:pilus assembly protein Flp/PilA